MPSPRTISAFLGLAALTFASPTPIEEQLAKRGTFSIEQTAAGKVRKNGAAALAAAYKKYNVEVPTHVAAAAAATATGSVVTNPEQYDESYLSPVLVGSQTLTMDFDTGSADFWVFSNELPASEGAGHTEYTVSSSKLKSGYTWDISYQDGSGAKGNVYVDKVVIGGVTATSQAVEAATSVSSSFSSDTDNDGLVGFAFSTINTVEPQSQLTWFDNVKNSLKSKLFTATLKKGKAGTYDFGYLDSSKYTGTIAYATVDSSQGFWEFNPTGYAIGTGSTVSLSIDGIADTGTTLLLLPQSVNTAYYKKVSGASYSNSAGGYLFPCSSTLPSFSLIIGGQKRTIPGSYLNYAPYSGSTCYGGLQPDTGIGLSIIGDIFLKGQYVVFDESQSTPRVGFAQQAGVST